MLKKMQIKAPKIVILTKTEQDNNFGEMEGLIKRSTSLTAKGEIR